MSPQAANHIFACGVDILSDMLGHSSNQGMDFIIYVIYLTNHS